MTMTQQDYFQCLICQSFFGNLWKVEKHVKQHQEGDEDTVKNRTDKGTTPVSGRRRGMLPIKKVTFTSCYVPVVKNQIDPAFLELCSEVVAKEEPPLVKQDLVADDFLELEYNNYEDNFSEDDETDTKVSRNRKSKVENVSQPHSPILGPRRSRLRAGQNIRRVAAILQVPDQQDDITDEQYEDMEMIQNLLNSDSEEDDTDFLSARSYVSKKYCSAKRKRGRPFGSKTKRKDVSPQMPKVPKTRKKRTPNLANWKSCEYCSKSFPAKTQLNAHLIQSHREKVNTIVCPINCCGALFINFLDLREHLKLHSNAERKEFATIEKLKTDQSPTLDEQFACKFCLERFVSFPALQDHFTEDHNNTDDILKCPCCDRDTPEDGIINFIGHIKGHHPERVDPFNERVKMAEERDKMDKPFKCDKCDMAFASKYQINSHAKKHEKQLAHENDPTRRFSCPVCQMRFKHKDNLRRHFTLHLENNPFVCDFPGCKRKFNSDYNLRRHRALHYENSILGKRFRCPLCPASFSRKDKLPSHFRNFHSPSEMTSPGIGPPKRYQCRLPNVRRLPKFEKYNPTLSAATATVDKSNESEAVVKQEINTVSSEEIHLVDKIILDADGSAIHVKGEHLSPSKDSTCEDSKDDRSETHHQSSAIIPPTPSHDLRQIQHISLTSLITSDPLYNELNKQGPEKVRDVMSYHYNMPENTFQCHLCEAVFSRAWTLQLHLKSIHNKTIMDQKQLESQSVTSSGQNDSTNKITLMCGQCAYPAKNANDLKKHMKASHVSAPVFKCAKCGNVLRTQKRLDQHIREIHGGTRNLKCRFCTKTFSVKSYLRNHERKVHNNSAGPIQKKPCPVEGCKRLISPATYYNHIKRHENAKGKERVRNDKGKGHVNKCMLCGDVLSCSMALRRHIDAVHLGKPINMGQRKGQKGRDSNPKNKRRGPKNPGDEWFLPLLQKACGIDANGDDDDDKLDQDKPEANQNQTESTGVDPEGDNNAGCASILGF